MCRPDWFNVEYVINPWMEGHVGRVDRAVARAQWEAFHAIVSEHAGIELVPPREGLPDMTFAANAGLVHERTFIPSRFRFAQRSPEVPDYTRTRDEGFGKLTFTPLSSVLFNVSYRDSKRVDENSAFGTFTAPTTGTADESRQKIGAVEGSWVINARSHATFK